VPVLEMEAECIGKRIFSNAEASAITRGCDERQSQTQVRDVFSPAEFVSSVKQALPFDDGGDLGSRCPSGASFDGADLNRAQLREVNLRDAHLCGATLTNADLSTAELTGATISQTQLNESCGSDAKLPPGLALKPCAAPK
jgi:uncharacterized protein YjbI with pentapeptide repeats